MQLLVVKVVGVQRQAEAGGLPRSSHPWKIAWNHVLNVDVLKIFVYLMLKCEHLKCGHYKYKVYIKNFVKKKKYIEIVLSIYIPLTHHC